MKEWNEWFYANIGGMYCCGPNVQIHGGGCECCGTTFSDPGTPVEVRDTTKEAAEALRKLKEDAAKCDDDYPHKCPFCGNAAYIGARKIDCKAKCKDSK